MVPQYVPIENNVNLTRHIESMGIVSTDKKSQINYRIQRDKILNEKKLFEITLNEVRNLRTELDDLKAIVRGINILYGEN